MKNYKIIEALKSLDKKEFKKFGEYVYSPIFNKNENIRKLFDAFSKYHPAFDNRNLTIETIFKKVFPKRKFDYFKISNIISDLYKLFESYLYFIGLEKDKILNKFYLLRELNERELGDAYEKAEKSYKKDIDNLKIKDENYFYHLYKYYSESLNYNISQKPVDHPKIIQAEFDNYLHYSTATLLKLYMYMHHIKKQNKVEFNMEMFENFSNYVKEKDFEDNPSYMVYKGIMMLELHKDRKHFLQLKEIKKKYAGRISAEVLENVLIFMNAYCAEMINKYGDESFYREEFDLLKEMIDRKIYTPESIIYPNFINIYKSGCIVGEYEWSENLLKEYQKYFPDKDRDNIINICHGFANYRKKDYEAAIECFSKTNFQWFILKMFVKTMTLRSYYEKGMFEQALTFIDSFKHYIKYDDKLLEEHKYAHGLYLRYTTTLIKIKLDRDEKSKSYAVNKLKKEIDSMNTNSFGVKSWLVKKINELID